MNGKQIIADGGFAWEPHYISIPYKYNIAKKDGAKRAWNRRLSSFRWKVEATFCRLKQWKVLKHCYRHTLSKHKLVWALVTFLHNLDVLVHPLRRL